MGVQTVRDICNSFFEQHDRYPDFIFCSIAFRDAYVDSCVAERRWFNTVIVDTVFGAREGVAYEKTALLPTAKLKGLSYCAPESINLKHVQQVA